MADISEEILKKNNIDSKSISLYVPHQANKRIIDGAAQRCGFKDDQVYININKYGNTTAGTIPICLDEAKELGRIKDGDLILLAAFGAGFTWGSMLVRWGK
jgi:3-oxoacyl-[acyl-carrier-protein] synthase III